MPGNKTDKIISNASLPAVTTDNNGFSQQYLRGLVKGMLVGYDEIEGVLKIALQVWNPSTLDWDRMTQPMLEGSINVDIRDLSSATDSVTIEGGNTNVVNVDILGTAISTLNSSIATLGNGGIFTGTSENVSKYKSIGIAVIASHASATNGLSCQFSSDNSNWDIVHSFTLAATTGKFFNLPVEAKWFRIIYTNGVTPQTYFRLQTIFHTTVTKESTLRVSEDIDGETAAQLSRVIIAGKKPDATYTNVNTTTAGNLKICLEEMNSGAIGQNTMANSVPITIASDQPLESLIETLQELTSRLAPLAGAVSMVGGQALRVSYGGGTFSVYGPMTSQNSIAQKALGGVLWTQRVAMENLVAIKSNIDNVTAA